MKGSMVTSRTPEPEPVDEEVIVVHTEEVPDADVPALAAAMAEPPPAPPVDSPDNKPDGEGVEWADRTLTWPHEPQIAYDVPHVARGKIATQLLEAADELGYPPAAIRSQTDGFLVPSLVYYHLFPSQIPAPADNDE